ncbi:hypothetical protein BGZ65_000497, partial [Modicella reniformis]
ITSVVLVLLSVVAVSQVTALPDSSQGHRIEIRADDVLPDKLNAEMKDAFQKYIGGLNPAAKDALSRDIKAFMDMDPEERRKVLEQMSKNKKSE